MSKHSPLIRLLAAKSTYRAASEACPHWDYEGGPDNPQQCCWAVLEAQRELKNAKKGAN